MLSFIKHKFTKKEKYFAKWGGAHLIVALLAGIALAGWLLVWESHTDHTRVEALKQEAVQSVDLPSPLPPNTTKVGGPFVLTNQDRKTVSNNDFPGKYLLIYFGYTSCPDMCPTGLQSMSRAMGMLKDDADKVQPLFITVDPTRDTPARMKEYDSAFHPKIMGLTGTAEQIAAVAKEYQVYYHKDEGDDDYEVEHSSLIYLMNPEGMLVSTFDEEVDPKVIVAALQKDLGAQP